MELSIPVNTKGTKRKKVEPADSATSYGSGLVDVFASPAMIALMEQTAMESILSCLPAGTGSVGIAVDIKHIKATPIGMEVYCETILEKIEGKKLFFKVMAFDEDGLIGTGSHTRYIVDTKTFLQSIKK
jgi:predicted thioesterase